VWQLLASLAPSPFVHRPSSLGAPLTLPWLLGHTCRGASGLPRSSQRHPQAWAVLVVLARRGLPPAPTLMAEIDWPGFLSPMLHMYVSSVSDVSDICCNYFINDVAKVDWGMFHILQVFRRHAASVCSKYFICFSEFCCNLFYLDVAYVSHICCNSMFQMF
jgi:hypothetical protein